MLNNWLKPINISQFGNFKQLLSYQFGKKITIHHSSELPDISKTKIAILGLDENMANAVRQVLYKLNFPFRNLSVVDLGNARKKETSFLIPVISELLATGIFPIFLGDTPELNLPQYQAYQSVQKLVNLSIVDENIPLTLRANAKPTYIDRIIAARKPSLFNMSFIGYQNHFVAEKIVNRLHKMNFETLRLGEIRQNIKEVEPLIRDADLLSFNISALKSAEAPGQANASPSGLFLEEACQISRYAGLSDKLTSIGFYGYQPVRDYREQTAHVVAQLIWYFIDGFYQRKNDYPVSNTGLVEYIVNLKKYDIQIVFWKSEKSGRWWMQVPVKTRKKHLRHKLVPCSYHDYQMACQEDISDRLLNAYKRFQE